jgi:hypothetical protein
VGNSTVEHINSEAVMVAHVWIYSHPQYYAADIFKLGLFGSPLVLEDVTTVFITLLQE